TLTAVNDVSLTVEAGEFFGFLGPNGAGKTTTINAVVGLAKPTAGSIRVFSFDNAAQWREARRLIGLAPQEYNFDRYLSIRDVLIFAAGYFGLRPGEVGERADQLLEQFGLASKAKQDYMKLSGGMKRRLTLARALIHSPKLLILDEPTAGVDVELRLELWDLLRQLNAQGITIFLTTHYLEEAELLCRRIGIIERGRLAALESTQSLLARRPDTVLTITLDRAVHELPPHLVARGARLEPGSDRVVLTGVAADELARTLGELERAGFTIEAVDYKRATLQDVFLELTRR
ncbi:MAG: ABC transporter ATP-binding protein, partial [Candidatus Eremiobacteraeota bacterium]|nr:ABC transporter ATP-binding protein [Candidatus Eremiobacteraeota bacterium]